MKNVVLAKRIAAIFTILLLFSFQAEPVWEHAKASVIQNGAMISVQDKDGKTIIPLTAVSITKDETAYDVLKETAKKHHLNLDAPYNSSIGDYYIKKIGNTAPVNQDYWGFFINGKNSNKGVKGHKMKNGDDLLLKIVSYPPKRVSASVSAYDKSNQQVISKSVTVIDGSNAYDALQQAAAAAKVKVEAPIDSQYLAYLANLGDTKLEKNDYWNMSMNGKSMDVGLSSYILKDGDKLQINAVSSDSSAGSSSDSSSGTDNAQKDSGSSNANTAAYTQKQIQAMIKSSGKFLLKHGANNEFAVMALKKSSAAIPNAYLKNAVQSLKDNNGTFRNVTDYERMAMGLTAAGKNASNFNGNDLIKKIYSNERMSNQGTNGIIFALLAYDSGQYKIPADAKWTRERLVQYLTSQQLNSGGWALYGNDPSVDITAMALSALSPYQSQDKVEKAIQKAVHWLSVNQNKQGGYTLTDNGGDSSETASQVIMGLSAVKVSPEGKEFTKAGNSLMSHLLAFKQKDGGFAHLLADHASDQIATTQALLALNAYQSLLAGKGSVYQFGVPAVSNTKISEKAPSEANKKVSKTTSQTEKKSSHEGGKLPETATNNWNLLFGGTVLIMAGGVYYLIQRRRDTSK